MTRTQRNISYDIIRIIAIFMVVVNHTNVTSFGALVGTPKWYIVLFLQVICVVCVPLFFMISGALHLGSEKPMSIRDVYKNRIGKQAIPFIVWSLVYVVARIVMGKIPFSISAFTDILHTPAYYQFWFMYTLMAIYMILPLLQTLLNNCDKKKTEYILVLWFIFCSIIPLITKIVPEFKLSEHADLVVCSGYLGYFILGHYLNKYKQDIKVSTGAFLWGMCALINIILSAVELLYAQKTGTRFAGFVYQSYMFPTTVLASCGAFIMFRNKKWNLKEKPIERIIKLSSLSLGVYYIHMLVLTAIEATDLFDPTKISMLIVKIILTLTISLAGAFVISLIPVVRRVLLGVK